MNDIQRLFCCCGCLRLKQNNQIAHHNFDDPTTFYIYLGIDSLNISTSTSLIIADFGSSYGKYSIQTMKIIIEYLKKTKKFLGIPLIIHNDIITNNWTKFFQVLIDDNSYYGLATGRSFYEQCLPTNSLSIGYSSASLHYLSKKPCNIHNHCYFQFANDNERKLFQHQSKLDFNLFIEHRSHELISGGILILNIPSINEKGEMGFNHYFDLIYKCVQLISRLTTNELLDFTIPFYLRSLSECIDMELFHRCSLKLIKVELVCLKSLIFHQYRNHEITHAHLAKSVTMLMQSGTELALKQSLQINGRSNQEIDEIIMQFWHLYEQTINNEVFENDINTYATYLILKKE
ncbi:unnamed protein product [Adineta steineri]|uniref:Uncharacterized protein n=1 Tax=Adineta steineri TaxID=433720 RepID=A0A815PSK9_9BILA|nr:unnamed protein product [Adineta steineri]